MPRCLNVLKPALTILSPITVALLAQIVPATVADAQDRCSFTRTNHDCTITLNRNSFVFPAPLQLYPGAVVTVKIENGNDFELYTLDPAPGQATPLLDVTSTALGNLNTILAAAGSLAAASASSVPPPVVAPTAPASPGAPGGEIGLTAESAEKGVTSHGRGKYVSTDPCEKDPNGPACRQEKDAELANAVVQALAAQKASDKAAQDAKDQKAENDFRKYTAICDADHVSQFSTETCMLTLLNAASQGILKATVPSQDIYGELNTLLTPDAQPPLAPQPPPNASKPHIAFEHLLQELCGEPSVPHYYQPCGIAGSHSLVHQQADASAFAAALLARLTKPPSNVNVPPTDIYPQPSARVLNAMQLATEEQAALDAIRKDLEGFASRLQDLANHATMTAGTVGYIRDSRISHHVSRTVNYTLNRLNLVCNSQEAANDGSKKVAIVTVAAVYGEAHWEANTGVALVFRPIRSFTVAPIISNAMQNGSYVSESKASPEVAPFVAADYRLGSDFKLFGWRGAFYGTGGVGYNTSQESADFLVGPSLSWRGLLLSGLCDFGHGARLAQGLTVGEPLGSGSTPTTITTIPTTNYWVPALTIGVSVRIPGISGR